jgi:hypothetical protein
MEYDGSGEPTKIAGSAPGEGPRVWTGTWGGKAAAAGEGKSRGGAGHERRRQEKE